MSSLALRSYFHSGLSSETHFCRFMRHSATHYQLCKTTDTCLDLAGEIAAAARASDRTIQCIAFSRMGVRTLRDTLGIVHVFMRVIPTLIYTLKVLWDLTCSFCSGRDVALNPLKNPSELAYNERAVGNSEKVICFFALTAKCIKGSASTFAFTVCQPILYLQTSAGVQLNRPLQAIGGAYQTLMFVKHGGGLLGNGFEMAFHFAAFHREERTESDYLAFSQHIVVLALGILENGLNLLYDVAKTLQNSVPAPFRIPLVFAISACSLYKIWVKTST